MSTSSCSTYIKSRVFLASKTERKRKKRRREKRKERRKRVRDEIALASDAGGVMREKTENLAVNKEMNKRKERKKVRKLNEK